MSVESLVITPLPKYYSLPYSLKTEETCYLKSQSVSLFDILHVMQLCYTGLAFGALFIRRHRLTILGSEDHYLGPGMVAAGGDQNRGAELPDFQADIGMELPGYGKRYIPTADEEGEKG